MQIDTRYLYLLIMSNFSVLVLSKTGAKVQPFFIPTKYFFKKIASPLITCMNIKAIHYDIFFSLP